MRSKPGLPGVDLSGLRPFAGPSAVLMPEVTDVAARRCPPSPSPECLRSRHEALLGRGQRAAGWTCVTRHTHALPDEAVWLVQGQAEPRGWDVGRVHLE